ncbi:hypothetical protein AVL59_25975 [Streptomyces griseochromogenes]|uniref:Uncharacterized protein n=1 Tax=Streptomyces griseochromogenes TaxID=68214 RepID=A0A1B1BD84_9ACTN|nr:hypothetical protein AVL59_25975 [Streptomyces griseochromogenes]
MTAGASHPDHPRTQHALGTVKRLVAVYGALSTGVFMALAFLAVTDRTVTSFMWGRSFGLLASAAVIYWLTVVASKGARWAYLRVRVLSSLMPIVIVAVDMVPGICPAWFAGIQAACALPLAAAAVIGNGSALRAAFPKGS